MEDFETWYKELERCASVSGTLLTIRKTDWIDDFDEGKPPMDALYARYPAASPDYSPDMYTRHIPEGSRWMHRNGTVYIVLFLTNTHSTDYRRYPPVVVYRGENGKRWSRPAADWDRSMMPYPWRWFETGYWITE